MTKRDFFIIVSKLLGIYWFISSIFSMFPDFIVSLSMLIDFGPNSKIIVSLLGILPFSFFLFISYSLVFSYNSIIKKLKLEDGFDDNRIEFGNLKKIDVFRIGCFLIGGMLFINNIPNFITQSVAFFQHEINGVDSFFSDKFVFWKSFFNLIIGFALVVKFDFFAGLLLKTQEEIKDVKEL